MQHRLRHTETALRLACHLKPRLLVRSINTILAVARRRIFNTTEAKMINWKALDNVPLLLYILALKTLLLCLAFAGVKIYQSNKIEKALKKEQAEKRRLAQQTQELIESKKED
ncbi:small integral membrane protein 11A-like [Micropterus salmoides]|uniref:small integral membrane protein 11A-like n=1 Tax=Micropterus salmoides TaxID=27706 RepID=UPI0018EA7743|nr:small integral membrane protein 11A-like isoform X1 [Micropterus salmoides]XP_038575404.1 small integral membrane protein 11A-like [Micropterus salmoides]